MITSPEGVVKLVVALRVSTSAPPATLSPPLTTVFPASPVPVEVRVICLALTDVVSLVVMPVSILFMLSD